RSLPFKIDQLIRAPTMVNVPAKDLQGLVAHGGGILIRLGPLIAADRLSRRGQRGSQRCGEE
ncbi:MAG: hypothetical protein ACK5EN_17575, partial [Planctomyces sp.]